MARMLFVVLATIPSTSATIPTSATTPPLHKGLAELTRLQELVASEGACSLPGCTLDFGRIVPVLQRAVVRGFVTLDVAQHTFRGLRFGYTGGAIREKLERMGPRLFQNYKSALDARPAVIKALSKRVAVQKTLVVGKWSQSLYKSLSSQFNSWFVFPLSAVDKPLEPGEKRPCSDHSRTGLNDCCDLTNLRHSLDTYNEIAARFLKGYFMHVSDVADAFPTLPLAPWLWCYYMCRFYASAEDKHLSLFVHLFADFGGAGWPGEFKIFFADAIVGMARSELVLTLEMPIYVDDMGLIGEAALATRLEMRRFQAWCIMLGLLFKWIKDSLWDVCS